MSSAASLCTSVLKYFRSVDFLLDDEVLLFTKYLFSVTQVLLGLRHYPYTLQIPCMPTKYKHIIILSLLFTNCLNSIFQLQRTEQTQVTFVVILNNFFSEKFNVQEVKYANLKIFVKIFS